MERVLVTGAAGFIGSHLSEALLDMDLKVLGLDIFTDYYDKKIKVNNLENCRKNDNFEFAEANLTDKNLKKYVNEADTVFHMAAQPGVRYSWENFSLYLNNNIFGTQNLLEACKNSKPRIVFASSSSVYGDAELPMKEDSELKPISPYGLTKLACEKLCYVYHRTFEIPISILRYFTVYGPRQRPDMAFHKFVKNILEDKEIEIYGDGEQTRDFTYVKDAVQATISAANLKTGFDIFNIASGNQISMNKVIELLESILGKKVKVKYMETAKGDIRDTFADISRAKELLNYEPKTSLEEGLKEFVKWYK